MCLSSDTLNGREGGRERHSFSWVSFYSFPMNVTAQLSWVMSYGMDSGNQHVHVCIYTHTHTYTHIHSYMNMCVHVCVVCLRVHKRKRIIHQSTLKAQQENWCYPSCSWVLFTPSICVASSGLFWATPVLRKRTLETVE